MVGQWKESENFIQCAERGRYESSISPDWKVDPNTGIWKLTLGWTVKVHPWTHLDEAEGQIQGLAESKEGNMHPALAAVPTELWSQSSTDVGLIKGFPPYKVKLISEKRPLVRQYSLKPEAAFTELKNLLQTTVTLALPDYSQPFTLCVDTCQGYVKAILTQPFRSKDRPLAFNSKSWIRLQLDFQSVCRPAQQQQKL
ncbi:hypothetical protein AMECASPLE_039180 [Ameca splendens]|uniref:Reverse transcriptase/retrotransposon-derived protein RNase H-like domain-containing protein n=1 Tax=Ameca splendens TaxID=208324 RepID=A0ABV0ZU79_9TELE